MVKPFPEANSSYYSYLFRTNAYMREVNKFSRGIVADRNRLYWESFKQMPSLVPPRAEQDQIVAYLRAQDAHVARFIKVKRDLIALLTEQKLRTIDRAVTRGLDSKVQLKRTGVEWLGEVPVHWDAVRLRQLATSIQTGPFGSQLHASDYVEGGVPIINPSQLRNGLILADQRCAVDAQTSRRLARHRLALGDVVFARRGELGRCALVGQKEEGWLCGTGSMRVRLQSNAIDTAFLMLSLSSPLLRNHLRLYSVGSTMDNANTSIIGNIRVPLPPRAEQEAICRWVGENCRPIDDATQRAEEEIRLIREYRDRLVGDVVTGQIDVRGWRPGLDDVASEDELAALSDIEAANSEEEEVDGDN